MNTINEFYFNYNARHDKTFNGLYAKICYVLHEMQNSTQNESYQDEKLSHDKPLVTNNDEDDNEIVGKLLGLCHLDDAIWRDIWAKFYEAWSEKKEFTDVPEALFYLFYNEKNKYPFKKDTFDYEEYRKVYRNKYKNTLQIDDDDDDNDDIYGLVSSQNKYKESRLALEECLKSCASFYLPFNININENEENKFEYGDDAEDQQHYQTELTKSQDRLLGGEVNRFIFSKFSVNRRKFKYKILFPVFLLFAFACSFQTMGAMAEFLSVLHMPVFIFFAVIAIVGLTTWLCNFDFADTLPREGAGLWKTFLWLCRRMTVMSFFSLFLAIAMSISVGLVFYFITVLGIRELLTQGFVLQNFPALVSAIAPAITYLGIIFGFVSFIVMAGVTCHSLFRKIKFLISYIDRKRYKRNKGKLAYLFEEECYAQLEEQASKEQILSSRSNNEDGDTELISMNFEEPNLFKGRQAKADKLRIDQWKNFIAVLMAISFTLIIAILSFSLSAVIVNAMLIGAVSLFIFSTPFLIYVLAKSTTRKTDVSDILQKATIGVLFLLICFAIWNLGMAAMPLIAAYTGVKLAFVIQGLFVLGIAPFTLKVAKAAFYRFIFSMLFRYTLGQQLANLWAWISFGEPPFALNIGWFFKRGCRILVAIILSVLLVLFYVLGTILTGIFRPVTDPGELFHVWFNFQLEKFNKFCKECNNLNENDIAKRVATYCLFKVPGFLFCGFLSVIFGGGQWRPKRFFWLRDMFFDAKKNQFKPALAIFYNVLNFLCMLPALIIMSVFTLCLSIVQLIINIAFVVLNWRIPLNGISNAFIPFDAVRASGANLCQQGVTFSAAHGLSVGSMSASTVWEYFVGKFQFNVKECINDSMVDDIDTSKKSHALGDACDNILGWVFEKMQPVGENKLSNYAYEDQSFTNVNF